MFPTHTPVGGPFRAGKFTGALLPLLRTGLFFFVFIDSFLQNPLENVDGKTDSRLLPLFGPFQPHCKSLVSFPFRVRKRLISMSRFRR